MLVPTMASGANRPSRATVALDDWCAVEDVQPDIIKVDVEGLELAVLEGARNVLLATRPVILLELHPWNTADLGLSLDALGVLVRQLHYGMETLGGEVIEDVSRFVASSREDTVAVNIVLAPCR